MTLNWWLSSGVGLLFSLSVLSDLSGQGLPRPVVSVEGGLEWSTSSNVDGPGFGVGVLYRPPRGRMAFTATYVDLGSKRSRGHIPHPTAGELDILSEGSDRLGAIGIRYTPGQLQVGQVMVGIALGGGIARRTGRVSVTTFDSTGAEFDRREYVSTLYGPRGELLAVVDRRIGRRFWLGLSGGPTLTLGVGAGEDGQIGAGALVTWVLRGQIGF